MGKSLIKYFVQVTIALGLYFLFVIYLDMKWPFILILVVVALGFLVFNVKNTKNGEPLLELQCDAQKYLDFIEEKYQEDPNQYHLSKAYALLFKGENDQAKEEFLKVDKSSIDKKSKFLPIYIRIEIMLAYYENDKQKLKRLLDDTSIPFEENELLKDYIKVFILLIEERYEETISLLVDIIPMQEQRVHIIELEYYLAYAYYKFNQLDDAKAVIAFIIGKNHKVVFTKLCDELHEKMN